MAEVMSVPATSGHPPKIAFDGFQSLVKMKEKTPWWASAGRAFCSRKMKKKAISSSTRAAIAASVPRKTGSARRERGDRPLSGRSPYVTVERAGFHQPAIGLPLHCMPSTAALTFDCRAEGSLA